MRTSLMRVPFIIFFQLFSAGRGWMFRIFITRLWLCVRSVAREVPQKNSTRILVLSSNESELKKKAAEGVLLVFDFLFRRDNALLCARQLAKSLYQLVVGRDLHLVVGRPEPPNSIRFGSG
jgi:hypothetical protein